MGQCASRMAVVGAQQASPAALNPSQYRRNPTPSDSSSAPSPKALSTSRTMPASEDFNSSSGSLGLASGSNISEDESGSTCTSTSSSTGGGIDQRGSLPQSIVDAQGNANEEDDDDDDDDGTSSLFLDVYPLVLAFLPPAEAVRNLPLCRFLRDAALTVLPTLLADELRPILPRELARLIDASPQRNSHWTQLAREWRSKTFVEGADAPPTPLFPPLSEEALSTSSSSDEDDTDDSLDSDDFDEGNVDDSTGSDDDESTTAAPPETALEAFLSQPDVRECLLDGCDPAAFAAWLHDETEDYRGLGDINFWLKTAYVEDRFEDEEDDAGPYVTLTRAGLGDAGVGVRPERYRDFANQVIRCAEGLAEHFLYVEITSRGGSPLRYSDGTPLIMWIDGFGRGVGPNKVAALTDSEKNQKYIEEQRVFAPRCTCPRCNKVILPRLDDHMGVNTTSILMEEPHLVSNFRGCEKDSYGRMIISEGDLDGLAFSDDEYPPDFGDGVFAADEEGEACGLPSLSSLDQLFEITLKAVRYHPEDGPSSTTVLHRAPLKITQTLVQPVGNRSGAVKYTFQAEEEGGEICAAVSFINVAKLSSFENEPFDCDPRPTSNQIWIDFWDVQLFSVKDGSGTMISRSDLFWKCRQLLCDD